MTSSHKGGGSFDDFGVKNDQKVSHNMILMSRYKGQLQFTCRQKGQKIWAMPERKVFFLGGVPLDENLRKFNLCNSVCK